MMAAAYTGPWPIRHHRTMGQVMAAEAAELERDLEETGCIDMQRERRSMQTGNAAFLKALTGARP